MLDRYERYRAIVLADILSALRATSSSVLIHRMVAPM